MMIILVKVENDILTKDIIRKYYNIFILENSDLFYMNLEELIYLNMIEDKCV